MDDSFQVQVIQDEPYRQLSSENIRDTMIVPALLGPDPIQLSKTAATISIGHDYILQWLVVAIMVASFCSELALPLYQYSKIE